MNARQLIVEGGHPLTGTVEPSGNSNSAVALILAGMLSSSPAKLNNVPSTVRVQTFLEIASQIGATVRVEEDGATSIHLSDITTTTINEAMSQATSYSFLLVAPILLQGKEAKLHLAFPVSRISTHLAMLKDFGCRLSTDGNVVQIDGSRMTPQSLWLEETSVTATILAILLASRMLGVTTIYNAAAEPSVQDLAKYLVSAGVSIEGVGSNLLMVRGKEQFAGLGFAIAPDIIEAASWLGVAAATKSYLTIKLPDRHLQQLKLILRQFEYLGVKTEQSKSEIVHIPTTLKVVNDYDAPLREIKSAPWPGFPSDLVALATVIATQAEGAVLVHETLYDNRMFFVDKLRFMGAQIILSDPHRAIVAEHPSQLHGMFIEAPDVRVGFALLSATLAAKGTSTIGFPTQLQRVFEGIIPKLLALGARVEYKDVTESVAVN